MAKIVIQTSNELAAQLKAMAKQKDTSVDKIVEAAISQYLETPRLASRQYSFIGIGHSGRKNLSRRVAEILEEGSDRREGWSLPA